MKKFIKKRTIVLMLICLCTGFFLSYIFFIAPKADTHPWVIAKTSDSSSKFITKETLVTQIKQKQKLVTTEVNLNEKITIDNSWGDWQVFKKIQTIDFIGTGIYTVDLSNLSSKNVTISGNNISINLSKPTVEMPTLDPNKTTFEPIEKGWFRFGDIKLSTEDQELLRRDVQDKMKDKMLESKYYDEAVKNSQKSMNSIIEPIVNASGNTYNLQINFN